MCCHRVSKQVSDYIRHAERHRDIGNPKLAYIGQMCDQLRSQAADRLLLAESERLSRERREKRKREVGDVDPRISEAEGAKLNRFGIMSGLGFQTANGIEPL